MKGTLIKLIVCKIVLCYSSFWVCKNYFKYSLQEHITAPVARKGIQAVKDRLQDDASIAHR
jgi:hypothetical protein